MIKGCTGDIQLHHLFLSCMQAHIWRCMWGEMRLLRSVFSAAGLQYDYDVC